MTFLHVQVSSSGFTDTSASRLTLCWHVVFDGQALLAIDTRDWIKTSEAPLQLRIVFHEHNAHSIQMPNKINTHGKLRHVWRSLLMVNG